MKIKFIVHLCVFASSLIGVSTAQASVTLTFAQVGTDVVATYEGSWSSWTKTASANLLDEKLSDVGFFALGAASEEYWFGASTALATGAWTDIETKAESFSGDAFGFNASDPGFLYAPAGYTVGTTFEGSMTFNDTDVLGLGFTPGDSGSFTSSGGTIDYTVAVPEPSNYGFLLGVFGVFLAIFARRRKVSA